MMDLTKLTKQEQAIVIGTFISMLGEDIVNKHIDAKKLESIVPIFNEMEDNTTPKQRRESIVSVLEKTVNVFLESKELG